LGKKVFAALLYELLLLGRIGKVVDVREINSLCVLCAPAPHPC
jgi:hypothetical protein